MSAQPRAHARADDRKLSRIERAKMPAATDVLAEVATNHGVCTNLLPMRRSNTATGETVVFGVPCGTTYESKCPACAKRAKALRMQQCREGWHLDTEPDLSPDEATVDQAELVTYRAFLEDSYADAVDTGDQADAATIGEEITAVGAEMTATGIRGTLPNPAGPKKERPTRSTRRRQDAPALPFRAVENTTVGRAFVGNDGTVFRPSTFITLTLPSYGRIVSGTGVPANPQRYDYRQAARDAIHFPRLVDRFIQNLRRVVGYDVQYFAAVEPQKRLAPHLHAAIRGTFPRELLRQVVAATYHQVWWPPCDEPAYDPRDHASLPKWDPDFEGYVDPNTGELLRTWDEALTELGKDETAEPVHVIRFGTQVQADGVTAGSKSAERCLGYLTKYLTKSVHECHDPETDVQKTHVDRMCEALRYEPCSDRCANWLLYGVQPNHAKRGMAPGRCSGKAHRRETLGFVGRRVLVSRKWSGKTLTDHKADRKAHVLRTLGAVGHVLDNPDDYTWHRAQPSDRDCPPRESLLMRAITDRLTRRTQYDDALAQLAAANLSATTAVAA